MCAGGEGGKGVGRERERERERGSSKMESMAESGQRKEGENAFRVGGGGVN